MAKGSPTLAVRFVGRPGREKLVAALKNQKLVGGDEALARRLARIAKVEEHQPNRGLIRQGDADNDVFLILSGSVRVLVNGREVAVRTAGEHVGEMSLMDVTAVRSSTVRCVQETVVARISEKEFTKVADRYPDLWRRAAVEVARRLREREKFHVPPRTVPVIFIGSSTEGLAIAIKVFNFLKTLRCVPRLWSEDVFECSETTIESLMKLTHGSDFALIILTADDVTKWRGRRKPSPRDNAIFELGLFMGALSRLRTLFMVQSGVDVKIPTDLLGITNLPFGMTDGVPDPGNFRSLKRKIRAHIMKHGPI